MLYYLANILWDSDDIRDRAPHDFKAAMYRVKHITDSYNKDVVIVAEGEGKKSGTFEFVEKRKTNKIKIHYLKYVNQKYIKRISSIITVTNYLVANVKSGDTILVYNAAPVQSISLLLFRLTLRRTRIIVEFEEFHRVENNVVRNTLMAVGEMLGILAANDFIFSNNNIRNKIRKVKFPLKTNNLLSFGYKNNDANSLIELNKATEHYSIPNIVYSGRMDYVGGIDIFVDALKYIEIECNIYITGKCDENIVNKIKKLKTSNKIYLLGFLPESEYFELLSNKCVCINPIRVNSSFSKFSFPSKIIQYLQTGNLVVSSAISALDSLGKINEYIYCYHNDNSFEMAKQIINACNDMESTNKAEIIKATADLISEDQVNLNCFLMN